jgi:alpha-D-ribose 1-methylphosphonate 5-triphosphate synthase subunit PhnI
MNRLEIDQARNNNEAALRLMAIGEQLDFDTERVMTKGGVVWTNGADLDVCFEVDCLTPEIYAPGV